MSQEIQIVNPGLPLQPGVSAQPLAYGAGPEPTPLRRVHQLLRGRYALAAALATVGALAGAAAGILLPKPAWESTAIVQIYPVIPSPADVDKVQPMSGQLVANALVELHTDRIIREAMQTPEWRKLRPYTGAFPPAEDVAEFSKNLSVKPMPMAPQMIQVTYADVKPDGKDVAQVAVKSIVNAFQALWVDTDTQQVDAKIQYFEKEKGNLDLTINADMKAIESLTKDVGDDDAAMVNAHTANLLALQKALKESKQMLAAAEHDRDMHRQGLNGPESYTADEIARVDPTMLQRINTRNETRIQMEDLQSRYGPSYPQVVQLKQLLALRDKDIQDAAARFNESYFVEQRADGTGGFAVSKDLSKLKAIAQQYEDDYKTEDAAIKGIYGRHAQILRYKDEIGRTQARVGELQRLLENLQFQKALGGTFKVVDDGTAPTQAHDRRPVFAAIGFLGGAALPIGFLLLIGLANPRYRFSDEAGSETHGLNLLGILPDLPDRLSDPEQASIAAHCVHQIRTMLQISGAPEERRVFAVTSAAPGDGKTSLTLALGLSYAACGARTLLIDCDLIGAGLTARMNVNTPVGVLEAIANRSLLEYVRGTEVADVSILPVGSAQSLHASTLSPAALRRLIDEARKQYDTILIDTGPILGSIEASLVCAAADAVVLSVARGQQRPLVEKAIARLTGIGARIAGVVFNRAQSGDFDRSISGASSLRSAAAGSGHNGHGGNKFGKLGRAVHSHSRNSDINEG